MVWGGELNVSELATLSRDAIVKLLILDLLPIGIEEKYYFVNDVYPDGTYPHRGGIEYLPMPFSISGEKLDSQGQLPNPQLSIGNIYTPDAVMGLIASFVERYEDLIGATVTTLDVFAKWLDEGDTPNPNAALKSEIYTIERKASASKIGFVFELSAGNNLQGAKIPKRQVTITCSWLAYRGEGCAYDGPPVEDADGNPLTAVRIDNCTVSSSRTISSTATNAFAAVNIGDTVVGQGIPSGSIVRYIADDKKSLLISKAPTNGTNKTVWFAPDSCSRKLLSCKRRFGKHFRGKVAANSIYISSPDTKRSNFQGLTDCFIWCDNLEAGMPTARKIVAVVGGSTTYSITSVTFDATAEPKWIVQTPAFSNLTVNSIVDISGVYSAIDGQYVLDADSFTGLGTNEFSVLAKPRAIASITAIVGTGYLVQSAKPHNLVVGDTVYIRGAAALIGGTSVIDGLYSALNVGSTTSFTLSATGVTGDYPARDRVPFKSASYMKNYNGATIFPDIDTDNSEAVFYYATTKTGGSWSFAFDRLQLDAPTENDATPGEYGFTVGGERVMDLLNYGGAPGALSGITY